MRPLEIPHLLLSPPRLALLHLILKLVLQADKLLALPRDGHSHLVHLVVQCGSTLSAILISFSQFPSTSGAVLLLLRVRFYFSQQYS